MIKFPRTAYKAVSIPCQLVQHFRRLSAAVAFLFFLGTAPLNAQVKLWGLASDGGKGYGSIFNLNVDGSDLNAFVPDGIKGFRPLYTTPLKASNGKLYGFTSLDGVDDSGVLFEYDPVSGAYTVLYEFVYATAAVPIGSLIEMNGKLYGMVANGGVSDGGALFEYDLSSNTLTFLHFFNEATGMNPYGSLLELDGKLYGSNSYGGSGGVGVLFEFDPADNSYTVLHDFQYGSGSFAYGTPIALGGKLYGTTFGGGVSDIGVIYEYDLSSDTYTVLHNFETATGSSPFGGNLIVSGGKFYGMTRFGGDYGSGVIYEYDPAGSGTYTVLSHFDFVNGAEPYGSLLESGGKFYGITSYGGIHGGGVLFEYDFFGSGAHVPLHNFDFDSGIYPLGSLMEADGKFYGLTSEGSLAEGGVLFEYDPAVPEYNVLVAFNKDLFGDEFRGRLIQSGNKLYGTARDGGKFDDGLIFEYDPAGTGTYTILHEFNSLDGESPYGGMIESGGKFYGTTRTGGDYEEGTLFVYDPAGSGTHTVLHHFDDANGASPYCFLLESGGKFYGTTRSGGGSNYGTLFEYDPAGAGTFTVLHYFDDINGSQPYGSLIESGGKFYGATASGGDSFVGVLYEYNPANDTYTVLHQFDGTNGAEVYAELLESGGKFYGATRYGGANFGGVLFEYDPAGSGTYTVLHEFEEATGSEPYGSLIEVDGKFYGTTTFGGDDFSGVIFEYDPVGSTYTVIKNMEDPLGSDAYCTLLAIGETPVTTTVSGKLIWEHDDATGVGNATVTMSGDESGFITTNATGTFSFDISSGSDVTITPTKTINKLNGLSSADVTRIQRHVANIEPLTDPYKIVAADVNKTNSVTSQDASLINQALLGNPSALNQIKTSWRFVPVSHNLNIPPWGFPENLTLLNVSSSLPNQNFYGIKTGDVVSTANPANLQGEGFVLAAQDQVLEAGTQVALLFNAGQFNDLAALQFALHFDADKLMLADVTPLGGLPLTTSHFGTYELSEGLLKMVWAQAEGLNVEEAAPLFQLTFNVLAAGGLLSEALQLDETALEGRAYTSDFSVSQVELAFLETTATSGPAAQAGLRLLQNRPNPFSGATIIGFVLPEACEAQLRVLDASGRVLFAQQKNYPAGKQEETLDLNEASGVLWYELTTPSGILTRKMTAVKR